MKLKVGLVVVAAFLAFAGSAQAASSLRYAPIKRLTELEAKGICERNENCVAYGAFCQRRSLHRIDCLAENEDIYGTAEISTAEVCGLPYHWFDRNGRLKYQLGKVRCEERA